MHRWFYLQENTEVFMLFITITPGMNRAVRVRRTPGVMSYEGNGNYKHPFVSGWNGKY